MTGRVVRRERALDHPYLRIELVTERDPQGREHTYVVGTGPGIAHPVPLWPDGTVTLLSQRRFGLDRPSLEVPGGHLEPGETPLEGARRELREETGLSAAQLTPLLEFLPSIKLQQRFHAFLAEGLAEGEASPDPDEQIELVRMPLEEACRRALSGEVLHGPSIVALLAARERVRGR